MTSRWDCCGSARRSRSGGGTSHRSWAASRHGIPGLTSTWRLDDRVTDLIGERIEVAIRIGPPRDSTMIMRRLAHNRRILVAAPAYLDRHGRPSKPEDLIGLEGLSYGDATTPWRLLGPGGVETEFRLRMRLRSDSGDAVHDWALGGAGIMLKSALDLASDLAANRLERVLPDYASAPSPVYALFASGHSLSTRARVFIDAMVVELADPERIGSHADLSDHQASDVFSKAGATSLADEPDLSHPCTVRAPRRPRCAATEQSNSYVGFPPLRMRVHSWCCPVSCSPYDLPRSWRLPMS